MSDWIEHDGSVMPEGCSPETKVQVRFRDGGLSSDISVMTAAWWGPALPDGKDSNWLWDDKNTDPDDQIVAYRVVAP